MNKFLLHYNNNYAYEYLRGPPGVCIQWYVGINALWCGPSTSHWRNSLRILLFFFKSAKSLPSSCDASILGWGPIKKLQLIDKSLIFDSNFLQNEFRINIKIILEILTQNSPTKSDGVTDQYDFPFILFCWCMNEGILKVT